MMVLAALIVTTGLSGCGAETRQQGRKEGDSSQVGATPPTAQSDLPEVDHPDYTHWKQFPEGTYVVRNKEVSDELGTVKVRTVVKLIKLTPDKVITQQQVTVDRPGQPLRVNPGQDMESPAKFRLPQGFQLEQFEKPSLSAKEVFEEKTVVLGKEYQSKVYTWKDSSEAGPMPVKLWLSKSMPGKVVRQESSIPNNKSTSLEVVVEVFIPGQSTSDKK